jgi:hypothetical protein
MELLHVHVFHRHGARSPGAPLPDGCVIPAADWSGSMRGKRGVGGGVVRTELLLDGRPVPFEAVRPSGTLFGEPAAAMAARLDEGGAVILDSLPSTAIHRDSHNIRAGSHMIMNSTALARRGSGWSPAASGGAT